MLATIPLLGKPSNTALLDIVSYHNGMRIELNKVNIGNPVPVNGRRTRVQISAKASTPYRENNYIQSMNFTYNRLNLTEVFFQYIFQGVELEAPVTTEKIVAYLKTFIPFIHEEWEFLPNTIYSSSGSFVLTAHPNSLRWQGSIIIPLSIVTDINNLILKDILDGIEDRGLNSDIGVLIHKKILRGLNYSELHPSLVTEIKKDILQGLKNRDFETHISNAFSTKFLPGHWILEDDEVIITSDISKPSLEALNDLITAGSSFPNLQHEIVSYSDIHPSWPSKGKVLIHGIGTPVFTGSTTLYYDKINIEDLSPGGTVIVEQMEDIQIAIEEINELLGIAITESQVTFELLDGENGVWILSINPDDAMFYGEMIVNDASKAIGLFLSGMIRIADTEYYKFKESVSYSHGGHVFELPSTIHSLSMYRARWELGSIIVEQQTTEETWNPVYTTPLPVEPDHLSLTFDTENKPVISYQLTDQLYIHYYDYDDGVTKIVNFSTGRAPFVSLETFNEYLSDNRQVLLMYVNGSNELCYRAQDDGYLVEYLIRTNVLDIMAVGRTAFNNLKIEFIRPDGDGSYVFDNVATDQPGIWLYETLGNEISLTIEGASILDETEAPSDD